MPAFWNVGGHRWQCDPCPVPQLTVPSPEPASHCKSVRTPVGTAASMPDRPFLWKAAPRSVGSDLLSFCMHLFPHRGYHRCCGRYLLPDSFLSFRTHLSYCSNSSKPFSLISSIKEASPFFTTFPSSITWVTSTCNDSKIRVLWVIIRRLPLHFSL